MLSDHYELKVLRELRDNHDGDGWLTPVQIAKDCDLPAWKVRAVLAELRRRRMASRGGVVDGRFNQFSITEHGMTELAAADQMRLVR